MVREDTDIGRPQGLCAHTAPRVLLPSAVGNQEAPRNHCSRPRSFRQPGFRLPVCLWLDCLPHDAHLRMLSRVLGSILGGRFEVMTI